MHISDSTKFLLTKYLRYYGKYSSKNFMTNLFTVYEEIRTCHCVYLFCVLRHALVLFWDCGSGLLHIPSPPCGTRVCGHWTGSVRDRWSITVLATAGDNDPNTRLQLSFNPLHAKFFWGNINIYLHFMSFLHIELTEVRKTPPQVREGPTYSILSINIMAVDVLAT